MATETVDYSSHDLVSLLISEDRDFLVRNNGDQVRVDSLKGKKIGLYFSASWCGPCHLFTPKLVELYNELSSHGDVEIVFVSGDRDDECFDGYFSKMPWLAIPFSDSGTRYQLNQLFQVWTIPTIVMLDESGKVLTEDGVEILSAYGAESYPFTPEKIGELKEKEERAKKEQSLTSLLVTQVRDYVISNNGNKVLVSELEGKFLGLYFSLSLHKECLEFTPMLVDVYEKLRAKGESFEIVMISFDDDEEIFRQNVGSIPWLALPYKDKRGMKLGGYFELSTLPSLVIIGPDGKTLHPNAVQAIEYYGIQAYPFTPEKFVELEQIDEAKKEAQTLESILVWEDRDFVIGKDGVKVPVSELKGKLVGLYFSLHFCKECLEFTPMLEDVYEKLRAKGERFEIVMISFDDDEEVFNQNIGSIPWLALPYKDKRGMKLDPYFEVSTWPFLVIIGPDGKTLHPNAVEAIEEYGIQAYPFTPEKFAELEEIDKAKQEAQTLESILVLEDRDFVIGKDGVKIPVSDLVGKNILLYFAFPPILHYLDILIKAYHKIKARDEAFEVIFIPTLCDEASFEESFSEMPWLAIPFGDKRISSLSRTFKVQDFPSLIVIGPTGKTVTKEAIDLVVPHGDEAYPFTEERLKEMEEHYDEMAKGWPEKVKNERECDPEEGKHQLVLTKHSSYLCDRCMEYGGLWSFYCDKCSLYLHPTCALEEEKESKAAEIEKASPGEGCNCDGEVCVVASKV